MTCCVSAGLGSRRTSTAHRALCRFMKIGVRAHPLCSLLKAEPVRVRVRAAAPRPVLHSITAVTFPALPSNPCFIGVDILAL